MLNESEKQMEQRLAPLVKKLEIDYLAIAANFIKDNLMAEDQDPKDWAAVYAAVTVQQFEHFLKYPLATKELRKDIAIAVIEEMQNKLYKFIEIDK